MPASRASALVVLLLLAGCNDPMSATDGISQAAGLAQERNAQIHVINPRAGDGPGPNPGGAGQRAAVVIERYNTDTDPEGSDAEGGTALFR